MFINPKIAIESGWITGIKDPEKQIQPNAIDFTLDKLFRVNGTANFILSESYKETRDGVLLEAVQFGDWHPYWILAAGNAYDGVSDVYVKVPEGVAAFTIIRSTLNRNGIQLNSGLYDSGYEGHVGVVLYPRIGLNFVAPGTRIGQIVFVESQNATMYAGGYNHEQGEYER